jgi:hypothetical protein
MRAPRALALLCGVVMAWLAGPARAASLDLTGTWYVLVHYQDSESPHPERVHWEDRLWVFERKGDTLEWKDYPIVVFDDESGRFEQLGGNRAARVLGPWEPNPGQQAEIARGLQFNTRGSKSKTLRGSDAGGWRSGAAQAAPSASVLTYSETWSIEGLPSKPVFERDDALSGGRAETLEGRTRYQTEEISPDGNELRGRFDRDGTRRGSFRMMRSGVAQVVRGSGKTNEERLRAAFISNFGLGLSSAADAEHELQGWKDPSEVPPEVREQVRRSVREEIERRVRERGESPEALAPQIDALAGRIEHLIIDERRSPEEIDRLIRDGRLAP